MSYNDLNGGSISSKTWFETLRSNKCLKSLKLDGCNLGDKVLKEIAKGITGHASLQKLSVRLCAAEDSSI
jgi:hypothetical protein